MRVQGAQRGERISKSERLVAERTEVSPLRVAGAGMGGAAFVYGVPRLAMLGDLLAHGRKSANPGTAAAAETTQRALSATKIATEPIGRGAYNALRKTPEGTVLLRWTPKSFRPALATGIGSYLLARNTPPTKTRLRPVHGARVSGP